MSTYNHSTARFNNSLIPQNPQQQHQQMQQQQRKRPLRYLKEEISKAAEQEFYASLCPICPDCCQTNDVRFLCFNNRRSGRSLSVRYQCSNCNIGFSICRTARSIGCSTSTNSDSVDNNIEDESDENIAGTRNNTSALPVRSQTAPPSLHPAFGFKRQRLAVQTSSGPAQHNLQVQQQNIYPAHQNSNQSINNNLEASYNNHLYNIPQNRVQNQNSQINSNSTQRPTMAPQIAAAVPSNLPLIMPQNKRPMLNNTASTQQQQLTGAPSVIRPAHQNASDVIQQDHATYIRKYLLMQHLRRRQQLQQINSNFPDSKTSDQMPAAPEVQQLSSHNPGSCTSAPASWSDQITNDPQLQQLEQSQQYNYNHQHDILNQSHLRSENLQHDHINKVDEHYLSTQTVDGNQPAAAELEPEIFVEISNMSNSVQSVDTVADQNQTVVINELINAAVPAVDNCVNDICATMPYIEDATINPPSPNLCDDTAPIAPHPSADNDCNRTISNSMTNAALADDQSNMQDANQAPSMFAMEFDWSNAVTSNCVQFDDDDIDYSTNNIDNSQQLWVF